MRLKILKRFEFKRKIIASLIILILLTTCYQPIPDGEYRLINWNGQTDYLPKQYFTFRGNEFGAFVIDEHGEHGDKIEYGTKLIEYQTNNIFSFQRNDTIYSWKYFLNNDTLTMKSQITNMYIICLKSIPSRKLQQK